MTHFESKSDKVQSYIWSHHIYAQSHVTDAYSLLTPASSKNYDRAFSHSYEMGACLLWLALVICVNIRLTICWSSELKLKLIKFCFVRDLLNYSVFVLMHRSVSMSLTLFDLPDLWCVLFNLLRPWSSIYSILYFMYCVPCYFLILVVCHLFTSLD